MSLQFELIGYQGCGTSGSLDLQPDKIDWTDRSKTTMKSLSIKDLKRSSWTLFGSRGQVRLTSTNNTITILDGFSKADFPKLSSFFFEKYSVELAIDEVASEGAQYGNTIVEDNTLKLNSLKGKRVFEINLEKVVQCVIPSNNRNEVEIQFQESELTREEDALMQITFRFPSTVHDEDEEIDEDDDEDTQAEVFQKSVLDTGMIESATGNVIVEFSKELGTFVTPRARFAIQMTSTYLRLHAQYDFKIMYSDINALFLLPKPDRTRDAFVISLDKPIRQGQQKYQHLVLETHKLEHAVTINLSEEEIQSKYGGQLQQEMSLPMSSLIAKIFKILTQTTVFVPKHFISDRETHCVKCSLKANDGFLYPLAKSFIFINKPTVIIKYDDVESIEFDRVHANTSVTKNFDMKILVKSNAQSIADGKEFVFGAIERSEFNCLKHFFESKRLNVKAVEETNSYSVVDNLKKLDEAIGLDEGDDSEDDEDYDGEDSDDSGDADSDDSGDDDEDDNDSDSDKKSKKSKNVDSSKKRKSGGKNDGEKKVGGSEPAKKKSK